MLIFRSLAGTVDGLRADDSGSSPLFATQASAIITVIADRRRDLALRGPDRGEGARAHARDGPRRHDDQREPRAGRRRDRRLRRRARCRCSSSRSSPSSSPTAPTPPSASATRGSSSSTRRPARSRARPRSSSRSRGCWRARSRPSAPRSPRSSCSRAEGNAAAAHHARPRRHARGDAAGRRGDRRRAARARRPRPARGPRRRRPPAARACARYLEERGVRHAMLAMLPGETRVVGTILLANRPGVVRDFSRRRPAPVRDARHQRLASRSSTTASSRRSGSCASSSASSSTRPTTTRSPAWPTARCSSTGSRRRSRRPRPADRGPVRRPRRLQDRQRHARPRRRRPAADRGRASGCATCVRPGDTVARLGGDEFAVLLDRLDGPEDVVVVAERIIAALAPARARGRRGGQRRRSASASPPAARSRCAPAS